MANNVYIHKRGTEQIPPYESLNSVHIVSGAIVVQGFAIRVGQVLRRKFRLSWDYLALGKRLGASPFAGNLKWAVIVTRQGTVLPVL